MYNSQLTEKRTSDAWREVFFLFSSSRIEKFFLGAIEKEEKEKSAALRQRSAV